MYIVFDTETTGLPRDWKAPVSDLDNWPRLVQLAWLQYDDTHNQLSESNFIIKPEGFTIPVEATRIHGISTEIAIEKGALLSDVLQKFSAAVEKSKIIVGHKIDFDKNIVGAEFLRARMKNNLNMIHSICTMTSATEFCGIRNSYGYKWPTLSELYTKLFNRRFINAHNALTDAAACAECFFELKKRGIILKG